MAGIRIAAQTYAEQRLKCQGKEAVVHTFKGKGTQTVRPFKVANKWEVRWDAKGDIFQVMLYDSAGELVDLVRVAVIRDDEGTIEDTADDLAAEVHRQIKLNADDCGFRPS